VNKDESVHVPAVVDQNSEKNLFSLVKKMNSQKDGKNQNEQLTLAQLRFIENGSALHIQK